MKIAKIATSLLLISVLAVNGCASAGNNFDSRRVERIQKGVTTERELADMFGPPTQRGISSEGGKTLTWVYSEARVKGETFIPFAGAFVGGTTTKTKTLVVKLAGDTVSGYEYTGGGFEVGGTVKPDPEKGSANEPPPKGHQENRPQKTQ